MFNKPKIKATISKELVNLYLDNTNGELPICKAPFSSLYFHPDGEIGACCLNRFKYSYGHYPNMSLKSIINSKKRKLQQKYISHNNFLLGCDICNENLNSKNFAGVMAFGYRKLKAKNQIQRMDFELSNFCNLDCIMCAREKTKKNTLYDNSFISELRPYLKHLTSTNFTGGEPFLIELYYEIWDILLKENPNCNINIQSNGSIINPKIINFVSNKNVFVSLSIDSVNKQTYEKIRKGADFDLLMKNFQIFNSIMRNKQHQMFISICPMTYNYKEIPEIIQFANKNKCKVFFNRVRSPRYLSLDDRTTEEYKMLIAFYTEAIKQLPIENEIESFNCRALTDFNNLLKSFEKESQFSDKVEISAEVLKVLIDRRKNSKNSKYLTIVYDILNNCEKEWQIPNEKLMLLHTDKFWDTFEDLFYDDNSDEKISLKIKDFLELENNIIPLE